MTVATTEHGEMFDDGVVWDGEVSHYVGQPDECWIEFPIDHPYELIAPALAALRMAHKVEPIPDDEALPIFTPDGRIRVHLTTIMEVM